MQDEMIRIGSILKAARDARGITQLSLAQATGTVERTIMDIENDKRIPKVENLYKIINVLDLPSDHIFRPDKVCYTLEMEQVMQFIQSRDEEDQAVFMKIARAYIEALVEKDAKKQTVTKPSAFAVL